MRRAEVLLIGWASRDITPDRPVNLCGQFHMRIAKSAQDPVTVTALSITSGADALVWVSCDLVMISREIVEACRERLKRRMPEFPAEKLIASVTHTHTAPDPVGLWHPPVPPGVMTHREYSEFLAERIVDAVVESWNGRKAGAVSWGYGHAVVGHNRRAVYFDDLSKRSDFSDQPGTKTEKNARMYGNVNDPQFSGLEGYVDHGVNLLFTFDQEKRLTGAVFNLPCPSQETEGMDVVSADFWHETRVELRKRHGDNLFVLPQCAPSGDLSPHTMYNKAAEQRMLKLKNRTSRQEIAERLAALFDETLQWARNDIHTELPLQHVVRTVGLSRRLITEAECRYAKEGLASLEKLPPASDADAEVAMRKDSSCFARKYRCKRILSRYEEQKKKLTLPVELHVVRLGDVVFATNPFELFLDYGLRIIARSPAVQTFLVQLAAGSWGGYLATRKAEEGESYSACMYCNEVDSTGGQQLVEETLKTINELFIS